MTTANDVISMALGLILVRSADTPLEPNELQDAIRQLNFMMASWNLPVGYTEVSVPNDEITTPDFSHDAMAQNLAVRLAPSFGKVVDPDLRQNAKTAMDDLLRIVVTITPTQYPQTLPQGAGNTRRWRSTFYPPSQAEIASEVDGNILQE